MRVVQRGIWACYHIFKEAGLFWSALLCQHS